MQAISLQLISVVSELIVIASLGFQLIAIALLQHEINYNCTSHFAINCNC